MSVRRMPPSCSCGAEDARGPHRQSRCRSCSPLGKLFRPSAGFTAFGLQAAKPVSWSQTTAPSGQHNATKFGLGRPTCKDDSLVGACQVLSRLGWLHAWELLNARIYR